VDAVTSDAAGDARLGSSPDRGWDCSIDADADADADAECSEAEGCVGTAAARAAADLMTVPAVLSPKTPGPVLATLSPVMQSHTNRTPSRW
jgi:hypothetical protein